MTTPAFGLYTATAMTPAQRVQAGHALALNEPVDSAGVTLFRRSLWLPVPPGLAATQALQLAGSTLQCRFAPTRFVVGTDSLLWFPQLKSLTDDEVRLELAWPAEVVAVSKRPGQAPRELALLRVDGDAVAAEATVNGRTGSDLPEPFVGTPLVMRLGETLFNLDERAIGNVGSTANAVLRAAPVAAAGTATTSLVPSAASFMLRVASSLVPSLTLAGRPTTPRLRLVAEQAGGETLLWQALLPGEQATVNLPAKSIADEWAPALEQVRGLCAKPTTTPSRLRLDIESDAPCQVTVLAAVLALQGEIELLSEAQQLAFDGQQVMALPLLLNLPAGVTATGLRLAGRVVAESGADANATATPTEGRLGALLSAEQTAVQPLQLDQPAAVAGLALCWQPLSSDVQMTVRLHSDGGKGPGNLVLAEQTLQADTAQAGWLALRWPALDLQAQRLWVRLTLSTGAGLCLFDSGTTTGWLESGGATVPGAPLPQGLAMTLLQAQPVGQALRAIGVHLAGQTVAATLPAGPLSVDIPAPLLPLLATHPITFTGGVRGSVTVESARLRIGL